MIDVSIPAERGVSNRVVFKCDLAAARTATRILRAFLAEQGLDETELFQCELCLAEACNNAVQYATDGAVRSPIVAEAIFHGTGVELRVSDHTGGFELRERASTIDPHKEDGRGLFIIQSFMDDVRYYRGMDRNTLVMRKSRTHQHHRGAQAVVTSIEDARRQLESCQQTISGMARELCVRSETLSAIFRCSAELGRSNDLEGFGQRLVSDLLHLTSADWFVLRLVPSGETRLVVFAASDADLRSVPTLTLEPAVESSIPLEVAVAFSRRVVEFNLAGFDTVRDPLRAAGERAGGLVQPLLFGDKLMGTLAIGRRESRPFSPLEAEMIRTFAEFMAIQVAYARNVEHQLQSRIVEHELDIARRIQRALLPRQLPQLPGFSVAASWESARQVGGDFYDAVPLGPHSALLVVADVMGKGVPAAMFATIVRSLLRALVGRSRRPAQLLRRLNHLLYDELSSVGMFITLQLVVVDVLARRLVAASAGHCPVIVASGDSILPLRVAGTPLGILPDATYKEEAAVLTAPSGLLLFTDGVTEARNARGEMFGHERLIEWLRENLPVASGASELRDGLASELGRFAAGEPLVDDQAFMFVLEQDASLAAAPTRTTGDFGAADARDSTRHYTFPPASLIQPLS